MARDARHQPRQRVWPRPGRDIRPGCWDSHWRRSGNATRGHIVLVASTAAQRGEAFHAGDYAASKGALLSLTKSLSSELAPQGILCNCVAPGWVRTEMSAGTLSNPDTSKKALSLIPLGRPAEPGKIAGPIVFLCTPRAGIPSPAKSSTSTAERYWLAEASHELGAGLSDASLANRR